MGWPRCYTWYLQYWFPLSSPFPTSFAPGFHKPVREKKMNFTSQMLELLVQNVTKYEQLCQGTWGHGGKPDKRLRYEQDPHSLFISVSCTLRRAGRLQRCTLKKKKCVSGESHRRKGIKQMFLKQQHGTQVMPILLRTTASKHYCINVSLGGSLRCQFWITRSGLGGLRLCISAWNAPVGCLCCWSEDHLCFFLLFFF